MGRIKGDGMVIFVNFDSSKILKYSALVSKRKVNRRHFFCTVLRLQLTKGELIRTNSPLGRLSDAGVFVLFIFLRCMSWSVPVDIFTSFRWVYQKCL